MVGENEGKLGVECHEEEDDERIAECDEESRHRVIGQRAFGLAGLVHLLGGVGVVGVQAEGEQHERTDDLQIETVAGVVHEVHDECHSEARDGCIDNIACCGTHAGDESVPAAFLQRPLYTQHSYGTHWCRYNQPYEHPLEDEIQYVDWHVEWHNGCKITK